MAFSQILLWAWRGCQASLETYPRFNGKKIIKRPPGKCEQTLAKLFESVGKQNVQSRQNIIFQGSAFVLHTALHEASFLPPCILADKDIWRKEKNKPSCIIFSYVSSSNQELSWKEQYYQEAGKQIVLQMSLTNLPAPPNILL